MRTYSATTAAYFARRGPIVARALVWIAAKNRETGAVETIGFWTGADHAEFVIDGAARTYYGAGAALDIDPLRFAAGLQVRNQRLRMSQIAAETQIAIRGYEMRHAPVEIHRALFDPETELLVDTPHRLFKGYVDKVQINTPKKGEKGSIDVTLSSAARALTAPLSRKRSDASLRARAPNDAFRQYASLADKVETYWGTKGKSKEEAEA